MGLCKVGNVNVITDAGPIIRRIIGAEDLQLGIDPQGGLQRPRDQMCRVRIILAEAGFGISPGDIEITQ